MSAFDRLIRFTLITLFTLALGACATNKVAESEECFNCGQISHISKSSDQNQSSYAEIDVDANSGIQAGGVTSRIGLSGSTNIGTSPRGAHRPRETFYDITINMDHGGIEIVSLPKSRALRWAPGDRVKVSGTLIFRH